MLGRLKRLERIDRAGRDDPYLGYDFVDYVKAANSGMKVADAPLGLRRMHWSFQLARFANEERPSLIAEGCDFEVLRELMEFFVRRAIESKVPANVFPRRSVERDIEHQRGHFIREAELHRAYAEAAARRASEAGPRPRPDPRPTVPDGPLFDDR